MPFDVSLVPCTSYEPEECAGALEAVLAPLGGLDWVRPGMRIVIKVNLVSAMKPEEAATTHPALLCALIGMLKSRGASVVIGDSPGGLYNAAHVNHVYDAAGMRECESCGAELNRDFGQAEAHFPDAVMARTFQYTSYLDSADAIIDFCKLKSHGMMGMSNAAKNLFGTIPGTMKPEYHYRFPDPDNFADMLVDLNEYFMPRLAICDAVVGMEGNGPTMGTPRKLGFIGASLSTHKLDLVCAGILGLKKDDVPTLRAAYRRGLIPASAEELSVSGSPDKFAVADFQAPVAQGPVTFAAKFHGPFAELMGCIAKSALTCRPQVKKSLCVGCSKCASICPAKAITMTDRLPVIDRKKCIHCFCCQEFCPKGAMQVHRPLAARLLNKQSNKQKG